MAKAATLPIIDISGVLEDQARIAKELVDAAAEYGFVYIKNTGQDISVAQVDQAFGTVCQDNLNSTTTNCTSH